MNARVWARVPKERNSSPTLIELGCISAVVQFNDKRLGSHRFYEALGIPTGDKGSRLAMLRDREVKRAEYKIMKTTKERRDQVRQAKCRREAILDSVEGPSYERGGFND